MSGQTLGVVTIQANGKTLRSYPEASLDVGGVQREPIVGADGRVYYAETNKEAVIECQVMHDATFSVDEIRALKDVTALFSCDTGQQYVIREAFVAAPPVINSMQGGKIPVRIVGPKAEVV